MNSKRGMYLSALIVIFGLAITMASLVLIVDASIRQALGVLPGWFNLYVALLLVARLLALYGIWMLKRLGVYALAVLEGVEVGMGVIVFTGVLTFPQKIIIGVPAILILAAVWYLALRPKWNIFP